MTIGANHLTVLEFEKNRALFSNQTAHDADPQTFVTYTDFYNDAAGRRRKRPGKGAALGASTGFEISAIHEFIRTNETTGVETQYVFRTFNTKIQRRIAGVWTDCVLPFVPTSSAWVFKNFNNRCFAVNPLDHFIYFDGSAGATDGREWYYVGVDGPAAQIGYSALSSTEYSTGTLTTTEGSKAILGVGTTFVAADAGRFIDIAGVRYQIDTFTDATHITLKTSYKTTGAAGVAYTIYRGIMDWAEPPKYAVGYKNSTTGHYSLIGPVLTLAEKDQVGRTVTITGIPYSAAAFQNGYDKIQIYRTPKNGATLVAVGNGEINNLNAGGTTSFTESASPSTYLDRDLLDLEAPQVLNRRPVDILPIGTSNAPGFSSIGEWNGRLFVICPRRARVFFSAALEDTRVGRPEECWPEQFSFRCTSPKGMVEIGTGTDSDQLLIHTAQGDRMVVGFDPLSFRLRRVETRTTEGFQGGSTAVSGSLIELHRDKRLIDYGRGKDLGRVIQDKLKACSAANFTKSRVAWFSYGERDFLFVSVPSTSGSSSNDRTFVIDYDLTDPQEPMAQVYDWSIGFSCFATVHNTTTGELELWAGDVAGNVYRLMDEAMFLDGVVPIVPTLKTVWIRPFGEGGRGKVAWIQVFTSEAGAFVGKLYLNEEPNLTDPDVEGVQFALSTPQAQYRSAKGKKRWFKPSRPYIFNALQLELTCPSVDGDIQIEKIRIGVIAEVPNETVEEVP